MARTHKEDKPTVPSGHTSGTPSPCCPEGRPAMLIKCEIVANNSLPGESSATLRCSGSGRHGCTFQEIYNNLHTPIRDNIINRMGSKTEKWFSHAPGNGALLTGGRGLVGLALDAEVHDVVPERVEVPLHCTGGSGVNYLQMAQLSTTMSQAHSATAFHFFT